MILYKVLIFYFKIFDINLLDLMGIMSLDFFFIPIAILLILGLLSLGKKNKIKQSKFQKKYIRQ